MEKKYFVDIHHSKYNMLNNNNKKYKLNRNKSKSKQSKNNNQKKIKKYNRLHQFHKAYLNSMIGKDNSKTVPTNNK